MIKEFYCELTKTKILYKEGAIFKVYVRRSNCPKKLLKVTTNVKDAMDAYNSIKLFHLDRAYVFMDGDKKLLRSGKDPKPYSLKGYKKPLNYRRKAFITPNMPETAHNALLALDGISLDGIRNLSMSKAIILMACRLASMPQEEILQFLESCIPDYKTHLVLSGLDNSHWVEEKIKEFGDYGKIDDNDLL